jgi:hypothetical protein
LSLAACLWVGQQQEASSQSPKIKSCFENCLRDAHYGTIAKKTTIKYKEAGCVKENQLPVGVGCNYFFNAGDCRLCHGC